MRLDCRTARARVLLRRSMAKRPHPFVHVLGCHSASRSGARGCPAQGRALCESDTSLASGRSARCDGGGGERRWPTGISPLLSGNGYGVGDWRQVQALRQARWRGERRSTFWSGRLRAAAPCVYECTFLSFAARVCGRAAPGCVRAQLCCVRTTVYGVPTPVVGRLAFLC